jgi:adenylosuccinate lyase
MATTTSRRPAVVEPALRPACDHARGHITDSYFYGNNYATPASRAIFCDVCRVQRWLDVEAALAQAQGELGVIPPEAAAGIVAAARLENIDLESMRTEVIHSRHSLVGLLRGLQAVCPEGSGQYVHYGATTQDIQDTGQVLEMRDVLDRLEADLEGFVGVLVALAERCAETVALGRTHARPALPITFGLKVASWLDEILRHARRVEAMRERVLVAQLFGGAGTMAGLGDRGPELLERFAARLGLGAPAMGWHVARDRIVEYVGALASIAGTLGRIADEIRTLSRPEVGEVEEAWEHGIVGSSTMPHKRNPERCEQVVVMSKLAAAQVGIALAGMPGEHERDSRTLRVEWACVPDVSHYCLAALAITADVVAGLELHGERMRENAEAVTDEIGSEALMLALGERLGKQNSHEIVYDLSQAAYEEGRTLRELLRERKELSALLDDETIERTFDLTGYLGASADLTRAVVDEARRWLQERAAFDDETDAIA